MPERLRTYCPKSSPKEEVETTMRNCAGQPSVLTCSSFTSAGAKLPGFSRSRNSRVSCRSNRRAEASISNNWLLARSEASGSSGSVRVRNNNVGLRRRMLEKESHRVMNPGVGHPVVILQEQAHLLVNVSQVIDQGR